MEIYSQQMTYDVSRNSLEVPSEKFTLKINCNENEQKNSLHNSILLLPGILETLSFFFIVIILFTYLFNT